MMVARFLSDGTPDPAFGTGGSGVSLLPLAEMQVVSIHELSNGRMVLVGHVADPFPDTDYDIVIFGLNSSGGLDADFGSAGVIRDDLGPYREYVASSVMLSQRELMLAGGFYPEGDPVPNDMLLARYRIAPFLTVENESGVELAADPSGSVDVGAVTSLSKVMQFTVKYDGATALTGPGVTLTGESHPGDFTVGEIVPFEGGRGSVVVRFTPSGSGQRTATLTISGTGADSKTLVLQLSGHEATPLESWRYAWFGSTDNTGAGADTADFDGDGLPNFMEYATASNPHQHTAAVCTVVRESGKTGFSFTRPAGAAAELTWLPETAVDPAGPWSSDGLTSSVESGAGGVERVKVLPTAADAVPRRFFRLRVTRIP